MRGALRHGARLCQVDLFSRTRSRRHRTEAALSFVTLSCYRRYIVLDRARPPRLGLLTAMLVILACWIILTTSWACSPRACVKRYWCFQAIQFTILLPFFFRSRIHNEAAQIVTCLHRVEELPCHQVRPRLGRLRPPARLIASMRMGRGGQHARHLAFACLPLVAFLQRHSLLAASRGWLRWLYLAAPGLAIVGAFGTFARAALVACAVWAALAWWQSRRKILVAIMMVAVAAAVVPLMGDAWLARISTSLEPRHHERDLALLVWAGSIDLANPFHAAPASNLSRQPHRDARRTAGDRRGGGRSQHLFLGPREHGWIGSDLLGLFAVFFPTAAVRSKVAAGRAGWIGDLARALSNAC